MRHIGALVWVQGVLKQEKAAGSETLRGGVTPFGKAERKGVFGGVFGSLQKSLRCRAAMSETTLLRGRNDVGKRGK